MKELSDLKLALESVRLLDELQSSEPPRSKLVLLRRMSAFGLR